MKRNFKKKITWHVEVLSKDNINCSVYQEDNILIFKCSNKKISDTNIILCIFGNKGRGGGIYNLSMNYNNIGYKYINLDNMKKDIAKNSVFVNLSN